MNTAAVEATAAAYAMYRLLGPEAGSEHSLYLYELQVSKKFQRKGLGALLVEKLQKIAVLHKLPKLMLTVQSSNATALSFYRNFGFERSSICPSLFKSTTSYKILERPVLQGDSLE